MNNEKRRTRDILAEKGQLLLEKLHITTPRQTKENYIAGEKDGWTFGIPQEQPIEVNVKNVDKKPPGRRALGREFVPESASIPEAVARKAGVIPKMWDEHEDELLRVAVEKYGDQDWKMVANDVPGRTHLQCLQRWKKALRPGLVKGHWTAEEDAKLLSLLKQTQNWQEISNQIPGRNAKQCRERWFLNLDPSINHGAWTPAEDEQLMELQQTLGSKWALISKQMTGRTENAVKTRFHTLERQQVRERGWFRWEDRILIEFCLENGRQWGQLVKLLTGRSKGQVKKRYLTLMQQIPQLSSLVEISEMNIINGITNPKAKNRALELIPMGTPDQEKTESIDQTLSEKTKSFRVVGNSLNSASNHNNSSGISENYPNHFPQLYDGNFLAPEPRKKLVHQKGSSWLEDLDTLNEDENRPVKLVRTKSMDLFDNLFNDELSATTHVTPNFQSTSIPLTSLSPSNMHKPTSTQHRLSKKATSQIVLEQLLNTSDMIGVISPSNMEQRKNLTNYSSSWLGPSNPLFSSSSNSFGNGYSNQIPELKNHSSSNSFGDDKHMKGGFSNMSLNLDDIFNDAALV